MNTKKLIPVFSYAIALILSLTPVHWSQDPCPGYSDVLDNGWAHTLDDPHNPGNGNRDEFGTVDFEPFIIKVNDYPPVKSFPITVESGRCEGTEYFYFSFDTDDNYFPINYKVPRNIESVVMTYKLDQDNNYLSGYSMTVTPPDIAEVGAPPDFVMKYDGTMHDIAWDINIYPWGNIVSDVVTYIPQSLEVSMDGVDQLNYNSSSEFIADIDGGGGYYNIVWSIRTLPTGSWVVVQEVPIPENFYTIEGQNYYFYDTEYKYNLTMPDHDIELKVDVYDYDLDQLATATKVVTVNPEAITFINHIETTENYGSLILNENRSDPISSGDSRSLIFGNYYTIRTYELPFIVDWNSTGKTEKHLRWEYDNPAIPPIYVLNNNFTLQASTERTMKSSFISTESAVIKTVVDEVDLAGLNIDFRDPWFYYEDAANNWHQSDELITYSSPLDILNDSQTSYGGVFLNQRPEVEGIYYSVSLPLTQTINLGSPLGTRTFYFQNWSATGATIQQVGSNPLGYDQKAVIFTNSSAVVEANLKGIQISNEPYAYQFNGQNKFLKTPNGHLHNVYESMGKVWYERSTDDGATWEIMNNGMPVNQWSDNAKSPAISSSNDSDNPYIYITYQAEDAGGLPEDLVLLTQFFNGTFKWTEIVGEISSFAYDSRPVVTGLNGFALVVYKSSLTSPLAATEFDVHTSTGALENVIPRSFPSAEVGSYSTLPSVTNGAGNYHLAFQHSYYQIRYFRWSVYTDPQSSYYYSIPSSGSGYNINSAPSISLANYNPVISWKGEKYGQPAEAVLRRGTKFGSNIYWGSFLKVGSSVNYTHNNSAYTQTEKTVMTWSQGSNVTKWIKRVGYSYSSPANLSHNGINSQVTRGYDLEDMKATIFRDSNPLYYFTQSTTDFSNEAQQPETGGLSKITENDTLITFGRSGVASINDIEFVFNIGDVIVGDSIIKFIDIPDTIVYTSTNQLSQHTRTNNFSLTPETNFYFSNIYYVVQHSSPDSALVPSDAVNFKAELVNASTDQLVGTFDNITYSQNNLERYANINYEVDCSGISPGAYYLRLVTSVNGDAYFALANIISDDTILEKKNFSKVNFTGNEIPATYDLAQNFPNPFNPSTTIRYQIPKDGLVTLKIYDILGKEVITLVNEEKPSGKYEVNFNASSLASGVYLYRLNVNDFVEVKKMIFLK